MDKNKKPQTEQQKSQMKQPYIAKRCPKNMKLQPGKTYLYCSCGLSNNQPFCDGSHVGTPFKPKQFVAKNHVYSSICLCRRAKESSLPYCDGAHSQIEF